MPVDRELVLFCTLALEAHLLVGLPQALDHSAHLLGEQLPGSGAALSLFLCAVLAYTFKAHFVTLLAVAVPTYHVLHALLDVTTALIVQAVVVWAVHALIRPPTHDRNLVGQGFEDPMRPGTLKAFPSLDDQPSVQLSVVIPACRGGGLQGAIPQILRTLQARARSDRVVFSYEVILVVCLKAADSYDLALRQVMAFGVDRVRVLRVTQELRAGRALREGALRSRGASVLLLDLPALPLFSQIDATLARITRERARDGGEEGGGQVVLLQSVPRQHLVSEGGGGKGQGDEDHGGEALLESISPASPMARMTSPRSSAAGMGSPLQGGGAGAGNPLSPGGKGGDRDDGDVRGGLMKRLALFVGDVGVAVLFPSLSTLDRRSWSALVLPRKDIRGILGAQTLSSAAYQTQLLLALRACRASVVEVPLVAKHSPAMGKDTVHAGGWWENVLPLVHLLVLRALVVLRWLQQVLQLETKH